MKKIWRTALLGGLLFFSMLLLVPETAQAKKVGKDKGVALTAKNFPDGWVLAEVKKHDKDKNGYLSKKEQLAVTEFEVEGLFSDLSQLRFFTNLKSLKLYDYDLGLCPGNEVDLTMFPRLETVLLLLETESWYAKDSREVRITVSGLQHLKELHICEYYSEDGDKEEVRNIKVLDLRDTPALKRVTFGDAKGVIFDDGAKLEELALSNMPGIPVKQIENFTELKELKISTKDPEFTQIDLSKLRKLTSLRLSGVPVALVNTAGARALKDLYIGSGALKELDLSENVKLRTVDLECPLLDELHVENSPGLDSLSVSSEHLASLDVKNLAALTGLFIYLDELRTLDVSGNPALFNLWISAEKLETLDLSKNPALGCLKISSEKLEELDLRKNPALKELRLDTKRLQALDTAKNKKLNTLWINSQDLTQLNLANNKKLITLVVSAPGLQALDLSANIRLRDLWVKHTSLTELKVPGLKRLSELTVEGNGKLETLDVLESPALSNLTVRENALTSLNLSGQTDMNRLTIIGEKRLTSLEIPGKTNPSSIIIDDTAVRSLVFQKLRSLIYLAVVGNPGLETLDLAKLPKLRVAVITDNAKLTELDFSKKPDLYEVNIDNNPLCAVTFGEVPNMAYLFCQNTALTKIDLSGATRKDLVVYCDEGVKVTGYSGTVRTEKRAPDEGRYSWWRGM